MTMTSAYENTKAWRAKHPDLRAYRAEEARKWRAAHPEISAAIKRRHRENNIERIREQDRESQAKRRATDPEGQRRRMAEFKARQEAKRVEMAGRPRAHTCELCGDTGMTVWDHDHETEKFRGWLCDRCNRTLGTVHDDPVLLRAMADYIEQGGTDGCKEADGLDQAV